MLAVHFHGIEKIVQAFESKGLPLFAVFSGKQLIHKQQDQKANIGDAAAELEQFLTMLNNSSNAIYTLKIYEEVPKGGIKENTPADYSLNFRLNLPDQLLTRENYYINKQNEQNEILSELKALHARLDKIEADEVDDDDDEVEQPQSIAGIANNALAGMLNNPEIQQMLAQKLAGFVGNLFNASGKPAPAAIAGIPQDQSEAEIKIDAAIDVLIDKTKGGAEVVANKLTALANIAQTNPVQYDMIINML